MNDLILMVAAGIVTLYLLATFLLGSVYSMIGGWRWDQFGLAAIQIGTLWLIVIAGVAVIGVVWYGVYLGLQTLPI